MTGAVRDAGAMVTVVPSIAIGAGGTPLPEAAAERVGLVVVDSRRMRPDMFEITFFDPDGLVLDAAGIALGTPVTISAGRPLITGEVTAIEGVYGRLSHTVVRGYTADHRLQLAQRSRTFTGMTDADVAREVALDAGLTIGVISPTRAVHDHVGQLNQTDWDFLCGRAAEAGCDLGVRDGRFFFGPAAPAPAAPPEPLRFAENLRAFRPRISAAGQTAKAELRVWDPLTAKVISSAADVVTESGPAPDAPAAVFTGATRRPAPVARGNPALGDLGPAPVAGYVVGDRPVATGAAAGVATSAAAGAAAGHRGATAAEAIGEVVGDPALLAGAEVVVSGVAAVFCGRWVLTSARHLFDRDGYRTEIEATGGHQRTLLGLTAAAPAAAGRLSGLICGIVSDIGDPLRRGRVKVTLPLLSPGYETDWAPVAQPGAGTRSGTVFGHEVGDQVLVGHERGDPRRPYVLGGIVSNHSKHSVGGEPVRTAAAASAQVWRGMVSPTGNRLAFHDELPPGATGSPTASEIVVGTGPGDLALRIDAVAGTVAVRASPAAGAGRVTIECGAAGSVDIHAGAGGRVSIDGGAELNLKAQAAVKIESTGPVEIKGNPIKLN